MKVKLIRMASLAFAVIGFIYCALVMAFSPLPILEGNNPVLRVVVVWVLSSLSLGIFMNYSISLYPLIGDDPKKKDG